MPESDEQLAVKADQEAAAAEYRAETIAGIRELCDLLEENPEIPVPFARLQYIFASLEKNPGETELEAMARFAKAIPGKLDKSTSPDYFMLERKLGVVTLQVNGSREAVCTRKQVGTEKKTEVQVVETKEVEVEVPVYEWDCEPVLAKAARG